MRRALKRLEGDVSSSTRRVEQSFGALSKRVSSTFDGIGRSARGAFAGILAGFSLREAQTLLDSATRIQNALKVVGLEGEELARVYDRLFASAQKNAAPFETLVTLYTRLSLAQRDLGVTNDEIIGFTDKVALALRVQGTTAEEARGALIQLTQALGGGIVRAEEFNSIVEGAPTILRATAAGLKEAGGSVAALRKLVIEGKVSSEAFFRAFEAGSVVLEDKVAGAELTLSQSFARLQNVMIDTATRFNDQTDASGLLARAIDNNLIPAIQELGDILAGVTGGPLGDFYNQIGNIIDRVVQLSADLGAMTGLDAIGGNPYIGPGRIQDRIDAAFAGTSFSTPKGARKGGVELTVDKPNSVVKPVTLGDYPVSGDGKGKRKREDEYARETRQVIERTAALVAETEAQRQLNPLVNDYGYAAEKARMERELLTAAENAGKQITPELRAEIEALAEQYGLATAESERLAESQDQLRESMEEINELGKDVMGGFIDDMIAGKSASEALAGALQKVGQKLIDIGLNSLFSPKGGGGGILSLLFGGGTTGFKGDILSGKRIGLFAKGTNFAPGGPAIVGEKGPELINLPRGSQVIPTAPTLRALQNGGGSISAPVHVSIDARGADEAGLTRVAREVAMLKATLPGTIVSTVKEAKKRRVLT